MEKKSEIILLDLFSKKIKPVIEQLLRQKKINPQTLLEGLRSASIHQRKKTRNDLAKLVGVSPSALRIKKEKTKVPQKKNPDIPMLDLMKNVQHQGKQHQFETLHKLVHLNKDFYNAFKQSLGKRKKEIQSVVALCYFFDLTRRYPKNDFQPVVGVTLPLYVGGKKFGNVEEFIINLENNKFCLNVHKYSNDQYKTMEFPNTKQGFIQLLDVFIPILKKSSFYIEPYWKGILRPLTVFDKQMLKRFHLVQDEQLKKMSTVDAIN